MLTSFALVALGLALVAAESLSAASDPAASAPVSVPETGAEAAGDALSAATEVLEAVTAATGSASTPHAVAAFSTLSP